MPNLSYTEITESCELVTFEEDKLGSTWELWANDTHVYHCLWMPLNTLGTFPSTIYKFNIP